MKSNNYIRASMIFVLSIGILNLLMWSFLILSGKVEDFSENKMHYSFHWISEFSTAVLLIVTGFLLHKKHKMAQNMLMLSLGFLLLAISGAFIYYLLNFDIPIFIFSSLITGSTILFIILNYKGLKDLILLTFGLSTYALLNLLGSALQERDASAIALSFMALLFCIIIIFKITDKKMVFKYLETIDTNNTTTTINSTHN